MDYRYCLVILRFIPEVLRREIREDLFRQAKCSAMSIYRAARKLQEIKEERHPDRHASRYLAYCATRAVNEGDATEAYLWAAEAYSRGKQWMDHCRKGKP